MYQKVSKSEAKHYIWGEECDSWVFLDKDALSIKLESMPPNTKEALHIHHKASQFFYIIKGETLFHINKEEVTVSSSEGIIIPFGLEHFIENTTNQSIDFLVISQPTTNNDRFLVDNKHIEL